MEKQVFLLLAAFATVALAASRLDLSDSEEVVYRVTRGAKKRASECRYKKGTWEECDPATNTEKRTSTLKRGDSSCEETKVMTRKCKKACKYEKGEWNECDSLSNTRTRTDMLKPKSDSSCEPTRTVTKKCKKAACRYNKQASWTDCDASTGKKTKVLVLSSGDPTQCEPNKKVTKPCRGGPKKNKGKHFEEDDDDFEEDE